MVYSEELGYDPDEWEECPPPDHFLVFSPFTRLVLSLSAIACAVLFFWLIDSHNKKGSKKEEEEKQEVRRTTPAESSPVADLLSTLSGLLTGSGRAAADGDFVQRSFRDDERSPAAAAAAAVREQAAKLDIRPDELSSSFHYKKPEEGPKTAADVRAELDQASFELRDLLGSEQAPPVPPHRSALPDWSSIDKSFPDLTTAQQTSSLSSLANQAQEGLTDAAQRANDFLGEIHPPSLSGVSDSVQSAYDRAGQAAHDAYDQVAPPVTAGYDQVAEQVDSVYNQAGQAAQDAYGHVAQPTQDAFGQVGQVAHDAYDRVAAPASDAYDRAGQTTQDAYNTATQQVGDAYDRAAESAHDAYDRAGQAVHDVYDRTGQAVEDTFNRAAAPVTETYNRAGEVAQDVYQQGAQAAAGAYDRAGHAAHDAYDYMAQPTQDALARTGQAVRQVYDRVGAPVVDAFGRVVPQEAYDQASKSTQEALGRAPEAAYGRLVEPAGHAVQDSLARAGQSAQDAFNQSTAPVVDAFGRALPQTTHEAYERAVEPLDAAQQQHPIVQRQYTDPGAVYPYALDRPGVSISPPPVPPTAEEQAAAAAAAAVERLVDPESARLEEDFERVQRDLDNLMAEHQVPLGVIIPGSSTGPSPAVSATRQGQQELQQTASSPIDEYARQLAAGLLTQDGGSERKPSSEIPSLHEIYEERQRQMSPPMGSPVKIPTQEDRAALRHWEEELARKEQEKLSKLVDTIVGGDDISDIAASEGTEHLLPASRISMYSQDSSTTQQQQQPLESPFRHGDELEPLPASAKINQKIDQISSALEQSLLSEIEQLARQTSTMQAELARARDSEYSADELSERVPHDPRLDAFQPAADVRFIRGEERADQAAPISHRNSERQSGESDDFVKITPPSHSGAPSPSPGIVCMSSSEEEQLKKLVEEYDVIGSSSGSGTLKKDASAPAALSDIATAAAPSPLQQQQQPLPSPTTAALLQEYETVQPIQQPLQQQQQPQQQHRSLERPRISAEEQAQLDQVLREFEVTPGTVVSDGHHRQTPRTPPHTPENTLMDPFGRPIQGLPPMEGEQTVQYMMDGEAMSPTTEIRLPLAPRGSIGDLKLQFPRLPSTVAIEVVDPAVAHLPKDTFLPADLEDVLATLANVDQHELFLPSQQQPDESAAAAAHFAAAGPQAGHDQQTLLQQQQQHLETPILSATPEPIAKKESSDSLFSERKPTIVRVEDATVPPAAPHAAVQQLLQQAASLDLSQPLQPPMPAFDRPAPDGKPSAATAAVNADFVVRQQQPGDEGDQHAAYSMKPQMMPAFDVRIKKPTATASATVPHEELERADAIFQDALDYMHAQKSPQQSGKDQPAQATGFIMEEEMLSSQGENAPRRPLEKSADGLPTSKLVKTNEIFDRLDPAHDDHDDMTYAPEIQSVEIPPDQLSETSELPHEELPEDDVPVLFKSAEAQKLEAEIRAQESAMDEAKSAMQHRAALAQAPYIISMNSKHPRFPSTPSISSAKDSPKALRKQSSLLSILGVTSTQEMLLKIDSLEALSNAMRKAGLDSTNVIFGIDYTASNKYQGEESFGGHSLHTIHPNLKNPYQQVITILGRTLAPFTTTGNIPVYGFGDAKTSDWSVFSLKEGGHCTTLEEVLKTYNEVTPTVELSGPTNFSPLIYQAIEICQRTREYHILVIIADGQVTNEKATRRAIVQACQYPLSIIVVGVGDGPWDMMRVFDESLPKRPWDNFHFVEFHEVCKRASGAADGDVKVAIQSLLEIPDQYRCICNLGLLKGRSPSLAHKLT